MSTRYWVGGTGNWNTDTSHWSASSGGASGASVPTSSDDVVVDSHSGFGSGGVITKGSNASCNNFTSSTGSSYTLSDESTGTLTVSGSLVFESGLTNEWSLIFDSTVGGNTLLFNNATISTSLAFQGTGGGWTLLDSFRGAFRFNVECIGGTVTTNADISLLSEFYAENGTFDANGHNITAHDYYFYSDIGYTPTLVMSSGTWEATGGDWYVDEYSGQVVTITPGTSTIKLTDNTALSTIFYGAGKTYHNVWLARGNNTNNINFQFSNTFSNFKDTGTAAHTITFEAGTTTIASTFNVTGSSGNLISLNSLAATTFILSCPSGTVICDYLDISNSTATGGAVWYAGVHSLNTTNNTGWIFTGPPVTSIGNASHDENDVPTKLAVLNTNGVSTVKIQINPSLHALKIDDGTTGSDFGPVNAKHDDNGVPALMGVSSSDGVTPVSVYADSFGKLLIKST